jgi:hypothetical protein
LAEVCAPESQEPWTLEEIALLPPSSYTVTLQLAASVVQEALASQYGTMAGSSSSSQYWPLAEQVTVGKSTVTGLLEVLNSGPDN